MPEKNDAWPGDIFVDTLRYDIEKGNNLAAPKWMMLSKTARRCLLELVKGHGMPEIDFAVDSAQETLRAEIQS